jgi:hypothetical protein
MEPKIEKNRRLLCYTLRGMILCRRISSPQGQRSIKLTVRKRPAAYLPAGAALLTVRFSIRLIECRPYWVITQGRRAYAKRTTSKNKSPAAIQLAFF